MADLHSPDVPQAPPPASSRISAGLEAIPTQTGSRLALALLGYVLAVVLLVNLAPFEFAWPTGGGIPFKESPLDIVANLLVFIPAGFLYRLTRGRGSLPAALDVLVAALAAGALIEGVRAFEAYRTSSVLQPLAEGAGAWLGALVCDEMTRRLQLIPAAMGRLILEPPLMGLVYMLIPLLWLSALGAGDGFDRPMITLLLGLCGASLLSDIYRYQLGPAGLLSREALAGLAAFWFLIGGFPGVALHPIQMLGAATAVACFAWLKCRSTVGNGDRRFEVAALRRAQPWFLIYLVLIALWPIPATALGSWHGALGPGFPELSDATLETIRLVEFCAASVLLGYILAEFRGREELPYRATAPRLLLITAAAVGALELLRGFHPDHLASLLRGALAVAGAWYGGLTYHLQRAHIVRLLRTRRSP